MILGLQNPWNVILGAILLLNPLDLLFLDFEALWILTSFKSQKEANPWIFPENGDMGTPWNYSTLWVCREEME